MDGEPKVKLHRRTAVLDGRPFTVLSPPSSMPARFATNHFHETWHILTDVAGAQFLGRLFWWLSYQRRPDSVVVIEQPFLVTNPFDGDRSSPIVLGNADLVHLTPGAVSDLKRWLPRRGRSEGSVRVSTASLPGYLALGPDRSAFREPPAGALAQLNADQEARGTGWNRREWQSRTDRVNGVVLVAAHPELLRQWAIEVSQLGLYFHRGAESTYLDHPTRAERLGEVQVLERFGEMVETALAVRERLFPGSSNRELVADERAAVWAALPPADRA